HQFPEGPGRWAEPRGVPLRSAARGTGDQCSDQRRALLPQSRVRGEGRELGGFADGSCVGGGRSPGLGPEPKKIRKILRKPPGSNIVNMDSTTVRKTERRPEPISADPPAVRVRDLRQSYGSFEAVKGVSFDIAPGELFALLGTNGAGKTT